MSYHRFSVDVVMSTAAFEGGWTTEVASILTSITSTLLTQADELAKSQASRLSFRLHDRNGTSVGKWEVVRDTLDDAR